MNTFEFDQSMPQPPTEHDRYMEMAASIVNHPGSVVKFDDAYKAVEDVHANCSKPPVPGWRESSADMDAATFFGVAEGLDTMLTWGDDPTKKTAAVFTTELSKAIPSAPDAKLMDAKRGILKNVLGLKLGSAALRSVPEQLVANYLVPNGSSEEQRKAAEIVEYSARG